MDTMKIIIAMEKEFPYHRWAADQGQRASPAWSKPSYTAPGTRCIPLFVVDTMKIIIATALKKTYINSRNIESKKITGNVTLTNSSTKKITGNATSTNS